MHWRMRKLSEEKNKKKLIYILIAIIIIIALIISSSMINITVLDAQPFNNLTLRINIT